MRAFTFGLALVVAGSGRIATAAPKGTEAKAAFDRGLKAYSHGDYVTAIEALGKSFKLERDVETLFAWAQAERQLDHCEKAIELYEKLLKFELPAANAEVIRTRLSECKETIAATKKEPKPEEPKPEEPKPEEPKAPEDRPWWHDPIGDALVVAGGIGLGVGIVYMISASSAADRRDQAQGMDYNAYLTARDEAEHDGKVGVISLVAGAACLAGGITWYATHRHHAQPVVTGWITPGSGGLAVFGRF